MLAATEDNVAKVIEILGPRLVVFGDILTVGGFFFTEDYDVIRRQQQTDLEVAERSGGKYTPRIISEEEKAWLCWWRDQLGPRGWTAKGIEQDTKSFAAQEDVPFKSLIKIIRYAVTGMDVGPPLWETLELLGYWSVSERCDVVICGHCFSEPGVREAILRLRDGLRGPPVAKFDSEGMAGCIIPCVSQDGSIDSMQCAICGKQAVGWNINGPFCSDEHFQLDWDKINAGIRERNLEFKRGHPRYDYNVSLRPAAPLHGPGTVEDGAAHQQVQGSEHANHDQGSDVLRAKALHRAARNKRRGKDELPHQRPKQMLIDKHFGDKFEFVDINILPDDTTKPPKAD